MRDVGYNKAYVNLTVIQRGDARTGQYGRHAKTSTRSIYLYDNKLFFILEVLSFLRACSSLWYFFDESK